MLKRDKSVQRFQKLLPTMCVAQGIGVSKYVHRYFITFQ